MRKYPTGLSIAFDLDGTLIDTTPDLIRVLNTVIAEDGLPATDYNEARTRIGYGSRALITHAYNREGRKLTTERLDNAQATFLQLYAQDIAQCSRPFEGVMEVLAQLKRHGVRLSVCTNKPGYLARPLIQALNMDAFFERIIGSDDVEHNKPAAQHIFKSVGHRESGRIIMVGDGLPDRQAARNAKVPCILMAYGYSTQSFYTLRAETVLRKFRELPTALEKLFKA